MSVGHVWVRKPMANETQGNAVFASTQFYLLSSVGGYIGTQVTGREEHFATMHSNTVADIPVATTCSALTCAHACILPVLGLLV